MWFAVVTACTAAGVLMIIEWGSLAVDPSEEHLWMRQQLLKLTTFMQELASNRIFPKVKRKKSVRGWGGWVSSNKQIMT